MPIGLGKPFKKFDLNTRGAITDEHYCHVRSVLKIDIHRFTFSSVQLQNFLYFL